MITPTATRKHPINWLALYLLPRKIMDRRICQTRKVCKIYKKHLKYLLSYGWYSTKNKQYFTYFKSYDLISKLDVLIQYEDGLCVYLRQNWNWRSGKNGWSQRNKTEKWKSDKSKIESHLRKVEGSESDSNVPPAAMPEAAARASSNPTAMNGAFGIASISLVMIPAWWRRYKIEKYTTMYLKQKLFKALPSINHTKIT